MLGVMLGAAMQPTLGLDGRPAGPQILTGRSAERSTGPFDPGPSYAAYGSQLPSYVTGTDYQAAAYGVAPPAEPERRLASNETARPEPVELTHVTHEEPPLVVVYPSMSGGADYGADTAQSVDEGAQVVITG